MKKILISMPTSLIVKDNSALVRLGAPAFLIEEGVQNRSRLTADAIEPWLKVGEKFEDCTFEGDVCLMHLTVVRVLKGITNILDDLIGKGIITSYKEEVKGGERRIL